MVASFTYGCIEKRLPWLRLLMPLPTLGSGSGEGFTEENHEYASEALQVNMQFLLKILIELLPKLPPLYMDGGRGLSCHLVRS